MKFSIIVVCLNPGEKLNQTLDSILSQTYQDYEVIVKDGGSRDGSIEAMREDVNDITERVDEIEKKPNKRYETVITAVITALVGGLIGYFVKMLGF